MVILGEGCHASRQPCDATTPIGEWGQTSVPVQLSRLNVDLTSSAVEVKSVLIIYA